VATERTLSIIKPDATERNIEGLIIARLESAGLRVVGQKRVRWKKKDAKKFYDVHKGQPFFKDLVNFMTSGPIVLQVLEGENAIARNREVMGATNPVDARPGTIRKDAWLGQRQDRQARDCALLQEKRDRGLAVPSFPRRG
jgi:nucleoside-diphosphate kinase